MLVSIISRFYIKLVSIISRLDINLVYTISMLDIQLVFIITRLDIHLVSIISRLDIKLFSIISRFYIQLVSIISRFGEMISRPGSSMVGSLPSFYGPSRPGSRTGSRPASGENNKNINLFLWFLFPIS